MTDNVEYYMRIDYPIELKAISKEDGGGWLAEINELKGCIADGENKSEALENLETAKRLWIETALKRKITIPLPEKDDFEDYSGKLTLRMPKSLHQKISQMASKEDISINQYILSTISFNLGQKELLNKIESLQSERRSINIKVDLPTNYSVANDGMDELMQARWKKIKNTKDNLFGIRNRGEL